MNDEETRMHYELTVKRNKRERIGHAKCVNLFQEPSKYGDKSSQSHAAYSKVNAHT